MFHINYKIKKKEGFSNLFTSKNGHWIQPGILISFVLHVSISVKRNKTGALAIPWRDSNFKFILNLGSPALELNCQKLEKEIILTVHDWR